VASNHGFADGNKRTALILVDLLLTKSGFHIEPIDGEVLEDALEQMVLNSVTHQLSFDALAAWFHARVRKT
jgi:prophage maintenance system killer protein